MHLSYSTSTYKGRRYKSYSIAESYRDGKTVRKRPIWKIGKLSDIQAIQIRLICKVAQCKEQVITQIKDIVVNETKAYLDISIVNELWNQWQLDNAFDNEVTNSEIPTQTIAKILTINRCTDPCSHYSIPKWVKKCALEEVLKIDLSKLNDDKIYYELDKIHKNKASIEKHLFSSTYKKSPESYGFINYDLTTSYFIGYKCNLSAFGKGKVECHGRRQILLGVLINDEGYPFKWDVYRGNRAEVKTLEQNIDACKNKFNLGNKNITIVFDRGIISEDNADMVKEAEMKYISALDSNQISGSGVNLEQLKEKTIDEKTKKVYLPVGFERYDEELYYQDSGVIGNKRYILGFNPTLFFEDRNNREEKMNFFNDYIAKENESLKNAKKERQYNATYNRIITELKRLKIKKLYEDPILKPIIVRKKLKSRKLKKINSFTIEIKVKEGIVNEEELLDGVCVFVTNHIEQENNVYKLIAYVIIEAYRNKTKIEDVFKNIKSFLKLRPFFVNTEAHVNAVYTVCMISYFINKYLANERKAIERKDFLNSKELYAPFKDIDIVALEDVSIGGIIKKGVRLPPDTEELLKRLKLSHIIFDK